MTENFTTFWIGQQIVEAFPEDSVPGNLLRDQDKTYGDELCRRLKRFGIDEVMAALQSPFLNPYAEGSWAVLGESVLIMSLS